MSGLEGFLIGAITVLIVVIVVLLFSLLAALKQMRQMTQQLSTQVVSVQNQLQLRAEPIMAETQRLLVAANPAVEQLRSMIEVTTSVLNEAQTVMKATKETVALAKSASTNLKIETESCMAAITTVANELSKMALQEAEGLRGVLFDARERATRQVERIDQMVTRTTDRIDETALLVQTGVLKPVGEVAAVLSAVQKFFEVLISQERKSVDKAYQDEEMFI
ncbi:MAG: hypothetical protein JNN15_09175 [Blastocatellia bacterium]|nr:hypothetical protein [Blastocatellia bacterium]